MGFKCTHDCDKVEVPSYKPPVQHAEFGAIVPDAGTVAGFLDGCLHGLLLPIRFIFWFIPNAASVIGHMEPSMETTGPWLMKPIVGAIENYGFSGALIEWNNSGLPYYAGLMPCACIGYIIFKKIRNS
jgi:hypothetical protein